MEVLTINHILVNGSPIYTEKRRHHEEGYPRYVTSERWIFFQVLSFHSEMYTDLTILSLAVYISESNETWKNEVTTRQRRQRITSL